MNDGGWLEPARLLDFLPFHQMSEIKKMMKSRSYLHSVGVLPRVRSKIESILGSRVDLLSGGHFHMDLLVLFLFEKGHSEPAF